MNLSFNTALSQDEQSLLLVANANWAIQEINENGEMMPKPSQLRNFFGRTVELFTSCCRKNNKVPRPGSVEVIQKAAQALSERIERVIATPSQLNDTQMNNLTAAVHDNFNNHSFYIARIKLVSGVHENALIERIQKAADENSVADAAPNEVQESSNAKVPSNTPVNSEQDAAPATLENLVQKAVDQLNKNQDEQVTPTIDESNKNIPDEELVQVKQEVKSESDEKELSKLPRYNLRPREKVNYTKEKIIYID